VWLRFACLYSAQDDNCLAWRGSAADSKQLQIPRSSSSLRDYGRLGMTTKFGMTNKFATTKQRGGQECPPHNNRFSLQLVFETFGSAFHAIGDDLSPNPLYDARVVVAVAQIVIQG
jgi:hypothetical protein